ncbi:nitrogenase component 1 [Methanoplanus limicola]|uniref:Oxidoreductase/nitrogenase component 1 n=1 Tax=Methanoplanus limicola DSM 2279 TaxID=937775 RepID=H1YXE0_9EURY|nr:nitrogenase component 1 [Methanoplanus limicola]EHQ36877.1 oxidoreductase/nitrogenase component 1 [Methanoplanus limicola DSM 2279]
MQNNNNAGHNACFNPLWPCAMVGAASFLAGIKDLGVVINGSSGCYYFAELAIPDPLSSTFLVQDEIIFGTEERIKEIIDGLSGIYDKFAVINTCVPSLTGDDITGFLSNYNTLFIDLPGYCGDFDYGYKKSAESIGITPDTGREGVNIDGICSIEPFHTGNLNECRRLLSLAEVPAAAVLSSDIYDSVKNPSELSITANPDYAVSGAGHNFSVLGIKNTTRAFEALGELIPQSNTDKVLEEAGSAEENIIKACDRFLRKNDPPSTAIFATAAYAEYTEEILQDYLDAEILCTGHRNIPSPGEHRLDNILEYEDQESNRYRKGHVNDLKVITEILNHEKPDLIIGSSFESVKYPDAGFFGITFPSREKISLHNAPITGIEGELYYIENILNILSRKS